MARAKSTIEIEVIEEGAVQSVGEVTNALNQSGTASKTLQQELKALERELNSGKLTGKEFEAARLKAGKLKDQIADTKAEIKAVAGTGVEALGGALTETANIGIAGFQGITSAAALFGGESEDLQKTLVKLQALAGLSQAITSLGGLGDSITKLKAGFTAFGKSATTALQGVKGAVAATGIGLLVIAVGTLVAYWDEIKGAVSGVSAEQDALNKKAEKNVEIEERKTKRLKASDNILRQQGLSEKEILRLKAAQVGREITALDLKIKQAKITLKSQVDAEERNKVITKGIIMFLTMPLQAILATVDLVSEGLVALGILDNALTLRDDITDYFASLIFDPDEVKTEGQKAIDEMEDQLLELKNEKAGYENEIKNIEVNAAKERDALNKKNAENTKKQNEENAKTALEQQRALEDARVEAMKDGEEKDLARTKLKYDRMIEDAKAGQKTINKETQELIDLYNKQRDNENTETLDKWKKFNDDKVEAAKQAELKLLQDMRAADDAVYASMQKTRDSEIALLQDGFDKEKKVRKAKYDDELYELQNALDDSKITIEQYQELTKNATIKYNKDIEDINKKAKEKELEEQRGKYEDLAKAIELWGGATLELTQSIGDLFGEIIENRLNRLNEALAYETEVLKSQLDQRLISQDEYNAQVQQAEQRTAEESKKLKRKSFMIDKANNLAAAIMQGALAVLSALGNPALIPPANFILAGIAGAASAVQIGTIAAQQFKAARGGIVPGNGLPTDVDSVNAKLAPGEAVINARSTSMFGSTLDMINRAGGGKRLLPNNIDIGGSTPTGNVFADNQQAQPVKAYVVETEITGTQKRVNRIERSVEF
jgi:hypothetical protein